MIRHAELYIVPLTFKHPIVTAHSVLSTRRTIILRLETTDGPRRDLTRSLLFPRRYPSMQPSRPG